MAIAALTLGIVSCVVWIIGLLGMIIGVICALAGIVLSLVARSKDPDRVPTSRLATTISVAGLCLSGITMYINLAFWIMWPGA